MYLIDRIKLRRAQHAIGSFRFDYEHGYRYEIVIFAPNSVLFASATITNIVAVAVLVFESKAPYI